MSDLLPDRTVTRHGRDWLIRSSGGPAPVYYIHSDKYDVLGPFITGAYDEDEMIDIVSNLDWV